MNINHVILSEDLDTESSVDIPLAHKVLFVSCPFYNYFDL